MRKRREKIGRGEVWKSSWYASEWDEIAITLRSSSRRGRSGGKGDQLRSWPEKRCLSSSKTGNLLLSDSQKMRVELDRVVELRDEWSKLETNAISSKSGGVIGFGLCSVLDKTAFVEMKLLKVFFSIYLSSQFLRSFPFGKEFPNEINSGKVSRFSFSSVLLGDLRNVIDKSVLFV